MDLGTWVGTLSTLWVDRPDKSGDRVVVSLPLKRTSPPKESRVRPEIDNRGITGLIDGFSSEPVELLDIV